MNKLKCIKCGEKTKHSFFREDENETVCEDCYMEWLEDNKKTVIWNG